MDKISRETPDLTQENIAKIAALFPDVMTEVADADGNVRLAIDFDALRDDLSGEVVDGPRERYQFTWPGKREAKLEARRPIKKTMRPCPEKSKDWDTTENLYIEGDNLEALKIMRETYAGKVKLIYIDPPTTRVMTSCTTMISLRRARNTTPRAATTTRKVAAL